MKALVTGANRGIGREVCRQLVAAGHEVIACTRSAPAALGEALGCRAALLDVQNAAHVDALAASIGPLDVLINNAAVMSNRPLDETLATETLAANLHGVIRVTEAIPLKDDAHIVMVSSGMGELTGYSPTIEARIRATTTREEVEVLAREFVDDVRAGRAGWRSSAYGVSKALLNALTRVYAAQWPQRRVNAVCPGWVKTDMGGARANREVGEGARSVLWAVETDESGGFFRDGRPLDW